MDHRWSPATLIETDKPNRFERVKRSLRKISLDNPSVIFSMDRIYRTVRCGFDSFHSYNNHIRRINRSLESNQPIPPEVYQSTKYTDVTMEEFLSDRYDMYIDVGIALRDFVSVGGVLLDLLDALSRKPVLSDTELRNLNGCSVYVSDMESLTNTLIELTQ